MQVELLDLRRWRTRVELANAIFDYLEIFHNRTRRHSTLGHADPRELETCSPWHEFPATRFHETEGTPGPPPTPGAVQSRDDTTVRAVQGQTRPTGPSPSL
jgi:hypothetical protein